MLFDLTNPTGAGKATGILTVPLTQQMDLQLAQRAAYTASDLVVITAGSNDVFELAKTFSPSVTALITSGQSSSAAQAQVVNSINQAVVLAANELVDLIDKKILAKGALNVLMLTNGDTAGTPTAALADATVPGSSVLLSQWIKLHNDTVAAGIAVKKLAVFSVNIDDLTKLVLAKPTDYGFSNVTTPICDVTKIALATGGLVTDGNSLVCTANTLKAGSDINTWLYADTAHYGVTMHKVIADFVTKQLRTQGWI